MQHLRVLSISQNEITELPVGNVPFALDHKSRFLLLFFLAPFLPDVASLVDRVAGKIILANSNPTTYVLHV
jgi:hypothetical protein